ncbi:MAG: alpha-glucosidase/alpha-galactosidase [Acidimicrobiales bacterium]
MRIVFIGAGSVVFTRNLTRDILTFPELGDSEIVLMDIHGERLSRAEKLVNRMVETAKAPARVIGTTDRRQALTKADYVIVTIQVGGTDQWEDDIRVPERFGVGQCVGDTIGPGGIFRGLRHLAVFDGLIEDMADLCPGALVLQYSNPMAILTWRLALGGLRVVGLCHSVQGTARLLAEYCEVPEDELTYWVAGINHQAWFLTLEHHGSNLYPRLRALLDNPEVLSLEPVRFELLRRFGYFVTESSGHASEYLPYFRKRPDLLAALVKTFESAGSDYSAWFGYGHTGGDVAARRIKEPAYEQEVARQVAGTEPIELRRSDEYGARIIQAEQTGTPIRINGNVMNDDLVTNLPNGAACVEVPCLVDRSGVHPCVVGALPPQLASLNRSNVAVQELVVKGHIERDREAIYQAMALDPLTAAVCSLDEIWQLTDDMFFANERWLPQFA